MKVAQKFLCKEITDSQLLEYAIKRLVRCLLMKSSMDLFGLVYSASARDKNIINDIMNVEGYRLPMLFSAVYMLVCKVNVDFIEFVTCAEELTKQWLKTIQLCDEQLRLDRLTIDEGSVDLLLKTAVVA